MESLIVMLLMAVMVGPVLSNRSRDCEDCHHCCCERHSRAKWSPVLAWAGVIILCYASTIVGPPLSSLLSSLAALGIIAIGLRTILRGLS